MKVELSRRALPVYGLFLVSGGCALVYETVWLRLFSIYCGNTTFAATAVLTAFMAGLGLGSWLIGRWVDESPHPLRLYALMELLIGVYAYLLPEFFLPQFRPYFGWLTTHLQNHFFPLNLGRFGLVLILLLFPTALMGGTFPALVKALGGEYGQTARRLAVLYAMNTLGGAVGVALAGFYAIGNLGLAETQRWAILANLIVAGAAYLLSRWGDYCCTGVSPMPLSPPTRPPESFLLLCFALAGFAALAYEIVAIRLLLFLLPYGYNNVYVFSTVLTTFLLGLFIGSLLVSHWIERLRNPLRTVALMQVVLALATAASLPILSLLMRTTPTDEIASFSTRALYSFLYSFLILLPPTVLMGAALPIYGRLGFANYARLGTDVGKVYASNTAGNIVGAFLGGFLLIPFFGIQKSFALVSLIYLLVGLSLAGAADPARKGRDYRRIAIGIGVAALVLLAVFPFTRLIKPEPPYKLVHYREGISSTLLVLDDGKERVLQINDFVAAGSDYEHLRNQRMMGYLPYLVHGGEPRNALVICLGTGSTAGALCTAPSIQKVTVVEIDEQVPRVLGYFARENFGVEYSRKARFVIEDGRAFVEFDEATYDIVTGEPMHPKRAGTIALYTREYYEYGRKRLAKGGVFAQWVPHHAIRPEEMAAIMRAFSDVFRHSYLWMGEQMVMLGTEEPLHPSYEKVVARMQPPEVLAGLKEIDFDDPLAVLSGFLLWDYGFKMYAAAVNPLTDDLPRLEFSRDLVNHNLPRDFYVMRQSFFGQVSGLDPASPEIQAVYNGHAKTGMGIAEFMDGDYQNAAAYFEEARKLLPSDRRLARWLTTTRGLLEEEERRKNAPPPPVRLMPERAVD